MGKGRGIPGLGAAVDWETAERLDIGHGTRLFVDGDGWAHLHAGKEHASMIPAPHPTTFQAKQKQKFTALLERGVRICVFFDGNTGAKKHATTCQRRQAQWKKLNEGWTPAHCHVPTYKRLLKDALRDVGVEVRQCWGEADQEVCMAANREGAVAVGSDSDLLLMAERVMPFHAFKLAVRHAMRSECCVPYLSRRTLAHKLQCTRTSDLAWYAVVAGNDYLSGLTASVVQKLSLRGTSPCAYQRSAEVKPWEDIAVCLPQLRALLDDAGAQSTPFDRDRTAAGVADLLTEQYCSQFSNAEKISERVRDVLHRDILVCYDAFADAGAQVGGGVPGLPPLLVSRLEGGFMGHEVAWLLAAGNQATFWHYPLYELPGEVCGYKSVLPVRRRAYAILPVSTVEEHGQDSTVRVTAEATSAMPAPSLHALWQELREGGWSYQERRDVVLYLLQDVLMVPAATGGTANAWPPSDAFRSIDAALQEDETLLALVLYRTSPHFFATRRWVLYVFAAAMLVQRLGGAPHVPPIPALLRTYQGDPLPPKEAAEHDEFIHATSLVCAATQTLLLADDICNRRFLADAEAAVLMNAHFAHCLYTRFQQSASLPDFRTPGQSPAQGPCVFNDCRTAATLLKQLRHLIRADIVDAVCERLQTLAACFDWYDTAAWGDGTSSTSDVGGVDPFCPYAEWMQRWHARREWWPGVAGRLVVSCVGEVQEQAGVVPRGAWVVCGEAAGELFHALRARGLDVVDSTTTARSYALYDPADVAARLRRLGTGGDVTMVSLRGFREAVRWYPPVPADIASALVLFCVDGAVVQELAEKIDEDLPFILISHKEESGVEDVDIAVVIETPPQGNTDAYTGDAAADTFELLEWVPPSLPRGL